MSWPTTTRTKTDLWTRLAETAINLQELRTSPGWPQCFDRQAKRYRCNGVDCARPQKHYGRHYPVCPEAQLLDARWQVIVKLYNSAKISPLAGWPDQYLAWVTHGLGCLEGAQVERMEAQAEEMRRDAERRGKA